MEICIGLMIVLLMWLLIFSLRDGYKAMKEKRKYYGPER